MLTESLVHRNQGRPVGGPGMTLTQCTGYGHWPAKWEDLLGNYDGIADRWLNNYLLDKLYECTSIYDGVNNVYILIVHLFKKN